MVKTYLISGAGSGIGRAIALKLSQLSNQNRLVLLGRSSRKLEETKDLLSNSKEHLLVPLDTTDRQELSRSFKEIGLESRNLCGVIANAGLGGANIYGPNDRWADIIHTNLTGPYYLVNEALPALRKGNDEYKHIILMSSILANMGVPALSAYCASKAGLLGLARVWALDFSKDKILVNTICPGWVDTDMAHAGIHALAQAMGMTDQKAMELQMSQVPLGKMSKPGEIAELVAYLMSPEQTSFTGQQFNINNGALMV
jgi:NAD(P)-dependent dehydrogenase (short-subunit alcohol dehydrogenase family)